MLNRILGILSYVGMALIFAALAVRAQGQFRGTGISEQMERFAFYAAMTGLVLIVAYVLGQWREIAAWVQHRHRNVRYGAISLVSVLVVIGILVAVNYLSARHNKRWDLTENRQYSLSDQTVRILQDLEAPVSLLVFDRQESLEQYRARLTPYGYHSNLLTVEYIDVDRNPAQASDYEIQAYGTLVVEYMGRRERVVSDVEQDITNALIRVLDPQERKVYFLAGHGEKDLTNTDQTVGYSGISDALRRDNYEFETLILAQTNEIPDDATAIVIAGPRTDLLEEEAALLREYLDGGGKLLVMLDPPENLRQPVPQPRLTALLREWGIEATQSIVVDLSGRTQVATRAVAAAYPAHPITDRFGLLTMFPMVRAMVPAMDAPPDRHAQPIVETAARSWAETDLASLADAETLSPDADQGDILGPVSIAVAVSAPAPAAQPPAAPETENGGASETPPAVETRIAAFGDSDFVANAYLGVEGNRDLFMNTVSWLAQQEGLIAIRPREPADRRVTMTANQINGVFWLSIVLLPATVLSAGLYSWWRRR